MARVPAFQAGYAGSIPVTRSIRLSPSPFRRASFTSPSMSSEGLQQVAITEVVDRHLVNVFGAVFFVNLLAHMSET